MVFPKYKNKHLAEALFNPQDFLKYKKWKKSDYPNKYLILYQKDSISYFKRKYRGKYDKMDFYDEDDLYKMGNVGVVKMGGIGSPHSTTIFEELIALGGKEFINLGTAGGLNVTGNFLCNKAVRDEGTSHHYIADSVYAYPDKKLTDRLAVALSKDGIQYTVGSSWTIDAPYRETKKEIAHYRNKGIQTVEMEASALFAVAKLRGVKIASVFAVSDVLGNDKWDPRFHTFDLKKNLGKLIDTGLGVLK